MKKYLGLILLLFVFNCKTSSRLSNNNIALLNGKWEFACIASFENPDELECPELMDYDYIEVDQNTGNGRTVFNDGFEKVETPFKIFKEGGKLMILYDLGPEENDLKGEILNLDEKEFKVKFESEKIYTIQKRAG